MCQVRDYGGILACLARLGHEDANYLSEMALSSDDSVRLGACKVASSNILESSCRAWCEEKLKTFFADTCVEVRKEAAHCFHALWRAPETRLTDYESLIGCFLTSPAFEDDPSYLLHALEETKHKLPEVALDICETFLTRYSDCAGDIRTALAGDEMTVGKVIFSTYAQAKSSQIRTRAMQVIDQMCLEGLYSADSKMEEFDR